MSVIRTTNAFDRAAALVTRVGRGRPARHHRDRDRLVVLFGRRYEWRTVNGVQALVPWSIY